MRLCKMMHISEIPRFNYWDRLVGAQRSSTSKVEDNKPIKNRRKYDKNSSKKYR